MFGICSRYLPEWLKNCQGFRLARDRGCPKDILFDYGLILLNLNQLVAPIGRPNVNHCKTYVKALIRTGSDLLAKLVCALQLFLDYIML